MANKRVDPPWPGQFWIPGLDVPGFFKQLTDEKVHESITVKWIGREVLEDEGQYGYDYPYSIIGYVQQGFAEIRTSNERISLSPGMVFWIRGRQEAYRIAMPGCIPVHDEVMLFGDHVGELFEEIGSDVGAIRPSRPELISNIIHELAIEARYDFKSMQDSAIRLSRVLVSRIAAQVEEDIKSVRQSKTTFEQCRHYILSNYRQIRTLTEVADACHISVPHMCRLFERFGELPPYKLVLRERLAAGARMLESTDLSIATIAKTIGFSDASRFTKSFSSQYGVTPSVYGHRRLSKI
jgi:AraC-like DNA-binding protein